MATLGTTGTAPNFYNVQGGGYGFRSKAYTMPSNGTVATIHFYGQSLQTYGFNVKGIIWQSSNGAVVTNAVSEPVSLENVPLAWYSMSFSTPPELVVDTSYWFGVVNSWPGDGLTGFYYYSSGGTGNAVDSGTGYASPGTYSGNSQNGGDFSVYITYEAAASGYGNKILGSDNVGKFHTVDVADIGKVYNV